MGIAVNVIRMKYRTFKYDHILFVIRYAIKHLYTAQRNYLKIAIFSN